MSRIAVLIEMERVTRNAFELHATGVGSMVDASRQSLALVENLAGFGLDVIEDYTPIPLFAPQVVFASGRNGFAAFASPTRNADVRSASMVVAAELDKSRLADLQAQPGVIVWPNSPLTLLCECQHRADLTSVAMEEDEELFDRATSAAGVDCRPFQPAVSRRSIRLLLGVSRVWEDGFRGQNTVVGIIDEGVNGQVYPVVGGFTHSQSVLPGSAPITSHGSMCAADILVAAPWAKLYDYPFLGVPDSGGALTMFQAVLNQRRLDGTPHLTNNSYGFVGRPAQTLAPQHEVWDINHPVHRKVREVIASGCACFFAAGNCGSPCPSGDCHSSGIGPGNSIHASNSLPEVITVAAVNSRHDRIGYSAQGPGGFEPNKPDVAAYSHFFGNFGPNRPAGTGDQPFDNGTSAAAPVAAGVGALLFSAIPGLTPDRLKQALIRGAINIGVPGWDADTGHGVVNASASYALLKNGVI